MRLRKTSGSINFKISMKSSLLSRYGKRFPFFRVDFALITLPTNERKAKTHTQRKDSITTTHYLLLSPLSTYSNRVYQRSSFLSRFHSGPGFPTPTSPSFSPFFIFILKIVNVFTASARPMRKKTRVDFNPFLASLHRQRIHSQAWSSSSFRERENFRYLRISEERERRKKHFDEC